MLTKLLSLTLALILLFSLTGAALAEALTQTFETPYYTLQIPGGWEMYDPEENEEGSAFQYLGYFSSPDDRYYWTTAALNYLEDWKDVSLWNADDATLEAYIEASMADFSDEDPQFMGIVYAGSIPFILIKACDEDGEFLYADTMTNGYVLIFLTYIMELDEEKTFDLSEDNIRLMVRILETFTPRNG